MSKEMKVGLVLVLILLGVFGAVVYRRLAPNDQKYVELASPADTKVPVGEPQDSDSQVIPEDSVPTGDIDRQVPGNSPAPLTRKSEDEFFVGSAQAAQSNRQQLPADALARDNRQSSAWDLSASTGESQTTEPLDQAANVVAQSAARSQSDADRNQTISQNPFFDTDQREQTGDPVDDRTFAGRTTPSSNASAGSNQTNEFFMDLSPSSTAATNAAPTTGTTQDFGGQDAAVEVGDLSASHNAPHAASQRDQASTSNRVSSFDPFSDADDGQHEAGHHGHDHDQHDEVHQQPQQSPARASDQPSLPDAHRTSDLGAPRSISGPPASASSAQIQAAEFDRLPMGTNAIQAPIEQNADERLRGFRKLDTQQGRAASQTSVRRPTLQLDSPSSTPPVTNVLKRVGTGATRTAAPWDDTFQRPAARQSQSAGSDELDAAFAPAANAFDPKLVTAAGGEDYLVQPNDSYWTISKKQYGSGRYCRGLALYNQRQVADPRQLRPGMTIKTPTQDLLESAFPHLFPRQDPTQIVVSTQARTGDPSEQCMVQQDDNFWKISQRQYGSGRYFRALARHNRQRIPNPQLMRPGIVVLTPAREILESLYPELIQQSPVATNVAQRQGSSGFFRESSGKPLFRVGSTDTLTSIAQSHLGRSSRWTQIYEMNRDRLKNPDRLKIGTVLRLPADASRVKLVQRPTGFR